jgi:hypothetical protein
MKKRASKGRKAAAKRCDAPPQDMQHGVTLVKRDGSEISLSRRWRKWERAAQAGQAEVEAGNARGFRVFHEPS